MVFWKVIGYADPAKFMVARICRTGDYLSNLDHNINDVYCVYYLSSSSFH